MTGDELRDRLQAVLDDAAKSRGLVPCPMCHGTGQVDRVVKHIRQSDVAEIIGVPRTSLIRFLQGRQGLLMESTLRLIDWLDEQSKEPA